MVDIFSSNWKFIVKTDFKNQVDKPIRIFSWVSNIFWEQIA